MSKLSSFLRKLSPEYREIASSFGTIVLGMALPKTERETILRTAKMLGDAADNIENSLERVEEAEKIGIDRDTLKSVIREMLPDIIGGLSEAAIRQMLDAKKKPPKTLKASDASKAKEDKAKEDDA